MGTWLLLGEWESAAAALGAASSGDFGPVIEASEVDVSGSADEEAAFAFTQANLVVRLLDFGCPRNYSLEQAQRHIERMFEEHPRFAFTWFVQLTPCLGWHTEAETRLEPVAALAAPPMLIIAGAHDPATPLSGAEALQAEFDNGSALLVYQGEGHGAVGRDDADITLAFLDFLSSGGELPRAARPIDRSLPSSSDEGTLRRLVRRGKYAALRPPLPVLNRSLRSSLQRTLLR
jgi:pimeloyl-ACP methyl ester carboxylesterase